MRRVPRVLLLLALQAALLWPVCRAQGVHYATRVLRSLEFVVVDADTEQELRRELPFREGDPVSRKDIGRAARLVRERGAGLAFRVAVEDRQGREQLVIRISGTAFLESTEYIQPEELIRRVELQYPSKSLDVQGTVVMNVTIGVDGLVRVIEVVAGPQLLVDAATRAVREWIFEPALVDDREVESRRAVRLTFGGPMPNPRR